MNIEIRTYKEDDAKAVAGIYYNTIHSINIRDYSKEQINAWAPYDSVEDYSGWQKKLAKVTNVKRITIWLVPLSIILLNQARKKQKKRA